ncbi:protein of unknown function [Burkholderia multivorans]
MRRITRRSSSPSAARRCSCSLVHSRPNSPSCTGCSPATTGRTPPARAHSPHRDKLFVNHLIFWHNRRFSTLGKWLAPGLTSRRHARKARAAAASGGLATALTKEKP